MKRAGKIHSRDSWFRKHKVCNMQQIRTYVHTHTEMIFKTALYVHGIYVGITEACASRYGVPMVQGTCNNVHTGVSTYTYAFTFTYILYTYVRMYVRMYPLVLGRLID